LVSICAYEDPNFLFATSLPGPEPPFAMLLESKPSGLPSLLPPLPAALPSGARQFELMASPF
jgi:hypothetical protein